MSHERDGIVNSSRARPPRLLRANTQTHTRLLNVPDVPELVLAEGVTSHHPRVLYLLYVGVYVPHELLEVLVVRVKDSPQVQLALAAILLLKVDLDLPGRKLIDHQCVLSRQEALHIREETLRARATPWQAGFRGAFQVLPR